ncbi:MAG: AsmA family protein [Candidatus Omnitrophica bacterium]|nr:AsmA family protein [Candidatus Omnitrophota bacterium]
MKKLFSIIIIIVVILIASIFTKNIIAKTVVSTGVRAVTGLKLDMKSFNIGVFRSAIDINNLRLFNPRQFEDRLMIDIPEIYVDYDLGALLTKKVHLEEVRLNLNEFIVVKNKEGELNLDSLKAVKEQKETAKKSPKKKTKTSNLQIDVLELKIGRVIYKDYYNRATPSVREYKVNINERYENIDDPKKLANLIVLKALMNTPIANLTGFDLGLLDEGLGATLGAALKAGETVTDTAKEATEKVTDTLKSILPFGGKEERK